MNQQRKWLLEMESTRWDLHKKQLLIWEDAVEMTKRFRTLYKLH